MTAGREETGSRSSGAATAPRVRTVTPDVRSDIYSTGATLYHLLCGERPDRDATRVKPLSREEFSPQVADIINRAMQPNPDLRFQTAEEMLRALVHLRDNDVRVLRLKRRRRICCAASIAFLCFGVALSFVGLKRIQTTESRLKLAEYSRSALDSGDTAAALDYAVQAFAEKPGLLAGAYVPQARVALTDALGVYDLADTYRAAGTVELPSAPLCLRMAPGGGTAAGVCSRTLVIFDTGTRQILTTREADESALTEVEYLDDSRVVYGGADGLCAYDIANQQVIWQGQPATGIAVSADGGKIAAIYRDESRAFVYAFWPSVLRTAVCACSIPLPGNRLRRSWAQGPDTPTSKADSADNISRSPHPAQQSRFLRLSIPAPWNRPGDTLRPIPSGCRRTKTASVCRPKTFWCALIR